MDAAQKAGGRDQEGVGATAEGLLEPLSPLIEYYAREMGELPGRLMMALGFLDDAQLTVCWSTQTPEARQAVEQARPGHLGDDQVNQRPGAIRLRGCEQSGRGDTGSPRSTIRQRSEYDIVVQPGCPEEIDHDSISRCVITGNSGCTDGACADPGRTCRAHRRHAGDDFLLGKRD